MSSEIVPGAEGSGAKGEEAPGGDLPAVAGGLGVVDLVAAALRADSSDLDAYHRVLTTTVSDLLPGDMVEVDRERSMKDRMAGREGRATSIRIHLGDRTLELAAQRGRLVATVAREVRGVVISRQEISVAEWTRLLAQHLAQLAAENADARVAAREAARPGLNVPAPRSACWTACCIGASAQHRRGTATRMRSHRARAEATRRAVAR